MDWMVNALLARRTKDTRPVGEALDCRIHVLVELVKVRVLYVALPFATSVILGLGNTAIVLCEDLHLFRISSCFFHQALRRLDQGRLDPLVRVKLADNVVDKALMLKTGKEGGPVMRCVRQKDCIGGMYVW